MHSPSSSHDWTSLYFPFSFFSDALYEPDRYLTTIFAAPFEIFILALILAAAALWLLENEDGEDVQRQLQVLARVDKQDVLKSAGFDSRKMLLPHYGQTFKFRRMGAIYEDEYRKKDIDASARKRCYQTQVGVFVQRIGTPLSHPAIRTYNPNQIGNSNSSDSVDIGVYYEDEIQSKCGVSDVKEGMIGACPRISTAVEIQRLVSKCSKYNGSIVDQFNSPFPASLG
eukprot:767591-Hanusia_phi.AAC.1